MLLVLLMLTLLMKMIMMMTTEMMIIDEMMFKMTTMIVPQARPSPPDSLHGVRQSEEPRRDMELGFPGASGDPQVRRKWSPVAAVDSPEPAAISQGDGWDGADR